MTEAKKNLFRRFKKLSVGRTSEYNDQMSNEFASAVVRSTTDAVVAFDAAGRIAIWNRGAEQLFGHTFEEAVGRDATLLFSPLGYIPAGEGLRGAFDAAIKVPPFQGNARCVDKNGTIVDVNIAASQIIDANGNIIGVSAIMRDIRYCKNAEISQIVGKERFQYLFDHMSPGIVITQIDGIIEQVNPAFCDMLDRTAAELIGTPFAELLPQEYKPASAKFRSYLSQNPNAKFDVECPLIHRNGKCIWCQRLVSTIPSPTGEEHFVLSILNNVTEERAAAESLAASEARFRGLFEHSLAGIVVRDEHGLIEQCNKAFCDLVGYDEDELIGTSITRLLVPECQAIALSISDTFKSGFSGSVTNEGPLLHKDGRKVWVRRVVSSLPQTEGSPPKFFSFYIDITENHVIADQLKESERRLRWATEATGGGTWDWNLDSDTVWWSENMYNLWGAPKGTSMCITNSMAFIHEEDRGRVSVAVSAAIAGRAQYNCEFRVVNPETGIRWIASIGRLIPGSNGPSDHFVGMSFDITNLKRVQQVIDDNATITTQLAKIADAAPGVIFSFKLQPDGISSFPYASEKLIEVFGVDHSDVRTSAEPILFRIHKDDQQSVSENIAITGQSLLTWHQVFRYQHPTKGQVWVEAYSSPVKNDDGSITWHGVAHDVTARKKYEAAIDELRRTNAVGAISSSIAHDVNNILTVITGNLYLLQREVTGLKGKEWLASAIDAAASGAGLNQRLLRLSGQQSWHPAILDLNSRMLDFVRFLQRILGENIRINTQLTDAGTRCHFDSGELDSAILNLAVNARDAMNGTGIITLETAVVHIDVDAAQAQGSGVVSGDFVRLALTDTGCGMTQELLDRVGEPFYSTKECGKGTGLGLFSVKAFARNFGGFVTITSRHLRGTTVSIYLPRIPGEAAKDADLSTGLYLQ